MNDEKSLNKVSKKRRALRRLNYILSALIVISIIILVFRYDLFNFNNINDEPEKLPPRGKKIINTHEHINDMGLLNKFLKSQRLCNVSSIIMVGTPSSTFQSSPREPFSEYLENNELIIEMAHNTNNEIIAFPTLNPNDEGNLERLKDYISKGAHGLNLWTGHHLTLEGQWGETNFYEWLGPLDRTDMYPIYEYCQKNRIPIIWSNNLGVREIREDLWSILDKYPDMILKIPHFGICFRHYNLPFIEEFLDNYPGGYTCFSWGHPEFVMEKFENISSGNRTEDIKQFFNKYQDRIMFGTDLVPTNHPRKTAEWMRKHTQMYIDILEKEYYHIDIREFTSEGEDFIVDYQGLNLSKNILNKVYYNNSIKFLNGKRWNESLDDKYNSTLLRFDGDQFQTSNITLPEPGISIMIAIGIKKGW